MMIYKYVLTLKMCVLPSFLGDIVHFSQKVMFHLPKMGSFQENIIIFSEMMLDMCCMYIIPLK